MLAAAIFELELVFVTSIVTFEHAGRLPGRRKGLPAAYAAVR